MIFVNSSVLMFYSDHVNMDLSIPRLKFECDNDEYAEFDLGEVLVFLLY